MQAIRQQQPIPDAKLAALIVTTTEMEKSLGQPSPAKVKSFLEAGCQQRELPYIVLAVSVKILSKYSNHAFATPVDERFSAYKVD